MFSSGSLDEPGEDYDGNLSVVASRLACQCVSLFVFDLKQCRRRRLLREQAALNREGLETQVSLAASLPGILPWVVV